MDDSRLLAIIGDELSNASGREYIDSNRKDAMAYYLGAPTGTEVQGRSKVVSTDVADAIEWIKPIIMEQLTRNYNVVRFDPVNEGDAFQADLESQYVFDVLMKENDGFMILHSAVSDALLQKNAILKVYYTRDEKVTQQRYTGLSQIAYDLLLSQEGIEVLQETERVDEEATAQMMQQYQQQVQQQQQQGMVELPPVPPPVMEFDVKIQQRYFKDKINVECIPPEEFRITRNHNNWNPKTARFTAHVYLTTASDLIKSGIPRDIVESLPSGEIDSDSDYRFHMTGESVYPAMDGDTSQRLIEVAECYLWADLDDDGVAEFIKVEVAGGDNPTQILSIEEMDEDDHPFISVLAIAMSHKFYGLSLFDRLKQIQDQKTTLWRNILDNLYLQNNQRMAVVEGNVNLDDLLISRPGGIIRQRVAGSIEPIVTPSVGSDSYQMMEYLDQVRAGRAGVNPEGPLQVQDIGDRVGSEGVSQLLAAREAIVDLMVRVICESGIKPLMYQIRNQARKYLSTVRDYQFRGQWTPVLPSSWPERNTSTVMVGTGSGGTTVDRQAIAQIVQAHSAIAQEPGQTLVGPEERFNAWRRFCTLSGMPSASPYFVDPASPKGQQSAQQIQMQQQEAKMKEDQMTAANLDMQAKIAAAETGKAKAQLENAYLTNEVERLRADIERHKEAIAAVQKDQDLQFNYAKLAADQQMKLTELEAKERMELSKQHAQNKVANAKP